MQKLWLRLRGKFHKFGGAGVVFGAPVPLSDFAQDASLDELAKTLMARIEDAMPRMGVPMLAQILLQDTPLSKQTLRDKATAEINANPDRFVMDTGETPEDLITAALDLMVERKFVTINQDTITMNPAERDSLDYYANSQERNSRENSAAAK